MPKTTRRFGLPLAVGLLALLCALALARGGERATAADGESPSFVLIQTDDQTLDSLYAKFTPYPGAPAIRAMQAINRAALHRPFLLTFVGTGAVCFLLAVLSLVSRADPRAPLRLAACVCYGVGTFLVTMRANVPRNQALAAIDPEGVEAEARWRRYLSEWTAWNHVRTVAALAALVLAMLAR